jgi:hypothetical protein
MKLMSDFKKNFCLFAKLDLKPRLLGHTCLVGLLFQVTLPYLILIHSLQSKKDVIQNSVKRKKLKIRQKINFICMTILNYFTVVKCVFSVMRFC